MMITRLMLVAWDFEGSDHIPVLPQCQRHILNSRTTISDSICCAGCCNTGRSTELASSLFSYVHATASAFSIQGTVPVCPHVLVLHSTLPWLLLLQC